MISEPSILSRTRKTSRLVTFGANAGYRLLPPCSMNAKWNPAVFAIACRWLEMLPLLSRARIAVVQGNGRVLSLSFRSGMAFSGNLPPKSGLVVSLPVPRPPSDAPLSIALNW